MQVTLKNATELGRLIRLARKAQNIRQDDAAGSIGVSENFLGKVERGGESVQWGKLFQVLDGLGLRLIVDLPDEVHALPDERDA
ncbi:helix-turn-helix domain-containing protein [Stutzerimonas nitrititolerans]|uniref:helix-turn-helix domain-containing protein n=1 Tax=Stutzerimonas nitrititolerans TaxID=2482751 RepID=UPI00289A90FB|nr:helix-turn-helix domain-containing protein [Stutzerimonas nitrititolerans]